MKVHTYVRTPLSKFPYTWSVDDARFVAANICSLCGVFVIFFSPQVLQILAATVCYSLGCLPKKKKTTKRKEQQNVLKTNIEKSDLRCYRGVHYDYKQPHGAGTQKNKTFAIFWFLSFDCCFRVAVLLSAVPSYAWWHCITLPFPKGALLHHFAVEWNFLAFDLFLFRKHLNQPYDCVFGITLCQQFFAFRTHHFCIFMLLPWLSWKNKENAEEKNHIILNLICNTQTFSRLPLKDF